LSIVITWPEDELIQSRVRIRISESRNNSTAQDCLIKFTGNDSNVPSTGKVANVLDELITHGQIFFVQPIIEWN